MEGSPLDRAYTAALDADVHVKNGELAEAEKKFLEAASAFEEVSNNAPANPSSRILQSLIKHYRSRAEYVRSDSAKHHIQASTPASHSTPTPAPSTNLDEENTGIPQPTGDLSHFANDSISKLFQQSTAAFVRAFEQTLMPAAPSDSFYVAAPKTRSGASNSGASVPTFNRVLALEEAVNAQKSVLDNGMAEILTEIAGREQQLLDKHTAVVDRMRAENDHLRIQVGRLKERWESLKESARKKQVKKTVSER